MINKLFFQTLMVMLIAELSTSVATLLDGVIIARFLSTKAIAAYGLTSPYTNMIKMFGGFFGTGIQIVYSRYSAKFQHEKANNVFSVTAVVLGVIGIAAAAGMFIFSDQLALFLGASKDADALLVLSSNYIRGLAIGTPFQIAVLFMIPLMHIDNDKKRIAIAINVTMITNLLGDLLVVLLFDGHLFGIALSTSVSAVFGFIVLMLHFRHGSSIKFNLHGIHIKNMGEVARCGIVPAVFRSFSMIRGFLLNNIILAYTSTGVLAAHSLLQNIKVMPNSVVMAIGTTTIALASVLYAEKDTKGLKQVFLSAVKVSFGVCLFISAAAFVFSKPIAMLFGAGEISALTAQALRCFVLGLPAAGIKMFYANYFQASNHKKLSYYCSVVGECVSIVGCVYILTKYFGAMGLWMSYPLSEIIFLLSLFVIDAVRFRRIPHSLNDLLFIDGHFDGENVKIFEQSIHTIEESQPLSQSSIEFCKANHLETKTSMYVGLVAEEVASNIFEHNQDKKEHFVDLKIRIENGSVLIRFRDNCRPFNPKDRIEMLKDDEPEHHIGLRIISKLSKNMEYTHVLELNQFLIEL